MSAEQSAVELLPCPFCGREAMKPWKGNITFGLTRPLWTGCGGDSGKHHPMFTMRVEAWNTRLASNRSGELVEAGDYLAELFNKAVRGEVIRDMAEALGAWEAAKKALTASPPSDRSTSEGEG